MGGEVAAAGVCKPSGSGGQEGRLGLEPDRLGPETRQQRVGLGFAVLSCPRQMPV